MAEDYRPHLLIDEDEIEYVDNKPTARSKPKDVDRFEHGTKLSNDLREIVDAYTRVQSSDSLSEEDIRIFEVILPDWVKFSDKAFRDFLQGEGMTITSVRDSHHGIVMTKSDRLDRMKDRVGKYTNNTGGTKKYEDIAGFGMPEPMSKLSQTIREIVEKVGDSIRDVEIREELLVSQIGEEGQVRAENRLIEKICQNQGELVGVPYRLSDNTPIIRAKIPVKAVDTISQDTIVCHVADTGFYGIAPAYSVAPQNKLKLDPSVDLESLPIVAVLDTGVDFPPELEPVIFEHWVPTGSTPGDKAHGTCVASKVAFADLGIQMMNPTMFPRCRIIDCNVRGKDPDSDDDELISTRTMVQRIQEAVIRYKDVTKIFNLSSAAKTPIPQNEISILGYELDVLALHYGVKFILAVGNHDLYKTQDSLNAILQDDENRIAAPADSMLNISVGAVVGQTQPGSLSSANEVAPYSRIGPGFLGHRKPDVVALGATKVKSGFTPPDTYAMMIGSNNQWTFDAGTSFTAPVVAGDLAQIAQTVPDQDILLAEALLFHGAQMPIFAGQEKIDKEDNNLYGNIYGRGITSPLSSMYSTPHRVTFVHRGTMNKLKKQHIKYLMPTICDTLDMSKRDKKIRVTITCVTQAPIDNSKGEDYLGAYINASLHSINGSGNEETKNPKETDGRKEWGTCYHFSQEYSSLHSGDWSVWLHLHARYDVKDDEDIDYAIAITIEDLTHSLQLYDNIMLEAQDRFRPVTFVRLPVRPY